ncbi:hypothetical protein IGI04_019377 [Brassica rapa subsp. trilocularis]|uniref:Uncharacterized protein n=1 Tax=Brassica rapa subsp. trilocularis TaxID=1813537 RepID=A0ABQ7MFN2_BRACM|nr:hypothetical protein IGI04_019377 [Brassica rapa subsp. trilocularis]
MLLDDPDPGSKPSREKEQSNTEKAKKAMISLNEEEEELKDDVEIDRPEGNNVDRATTINIDRLTGNTVDRHSTPAEPIDLDHARLDLDHEVSQNDRDFSLLARLARTACTDDRADDLSTLFDPIMDFSFGNFSKARILKLSESLGFVGTQLVRSECPAASAERATALADRPTYVTVLTALDLAGSDAS